MDKPDIKESIQAVVQRLGFLKNYSSLLAPAGICIAAVIVLVFTNMISGKLNKRINNESIRVGDDVKRILETAVSKDQWKEEQKYQTSYRQDANAVAAMVTESTQRPLLSYKLFPTPIDSSSLIFEQFGQRFRSGIEHILDKIHAGNCPTVEELTRHQSATAAGGRTAVNTYEYTAASGVDAAIRDVLCLDKAKAASVYADPLIISGYDFWREYQYPGVDAAVGDCWFWQLGYWVVEDVLETVGKVNYGCANIFASPVKRIMYVGFYNADQGNSVTSRTASDTTAIVADNVRPSYAIVGNTWLNETCTGRFCNEDIDVIHFKLSVLVDTGAVSDFIKELCSSKTHIFTGYYGTDPARTLKHNQITVLQYCSSPIDRDDPMHSLYRYGQDAVVQLDLTCEYVLVKTGYEPIKPESIKMLLTPQAVPGMEVY